MSYVSKFLTQTVREWDRSASAGSSEIGGCLRQVAYSKRKTPWDEGFEQNWGFMERGHAVEAWAVSRMIANGSGATKMGKFQVTYRDGRLSATPDGQLRGGEISIDFKSFDPRTESMSLPFHKHILQVRIGARLNPVTSRGLLIYINCSDFSDQQEFGPYDELTDDELASLKVTAGSVYTIEPEDHERTGYALDECKRCPFHQRCLGKPIGDEGKLTAADFKSLNKFRNAYRTAQRAEDEARHDKRMAQEQVRELFRRCDVSAVKRMASITRRETAAGVADVVTVR